MDAYSVRYYGFSPSTYVRGLFKQILEQITDTAPNDSNVRGAIHRGDESFQGLIRVCSAAGEFSAFASAKDVTKLAQKLSIKMSNQIRKWKSSRTLGELDHSS